jgi:phage terminase large subunit-like protein
VATWEGQSIAVCEDEINRIGPTSFDLELQHETDTDNPNALLSKAILDACRVSSHPDLYRVGVGVDPSGGAGRCGIVPAGVARVGKDTHGFTIGDWSTPLGTKSADWATAVLRCYHAVKADFIAVEANFGGDMAENNIRSAVLRDDEGEVVLLGTNVNIVMVTASRGKEVRAQPVATLFQLGKAHHVGYFPALEKQWTKWEPGTKPSPDGLDAEVWVYTELMIGAPAPPASESFELIVMYSSKRGCQYGTKRTGARSGWHTNSRGRAGAGRQSL